MKFIGALLVIVWLTTLIAYMFAYANVRDSCDGEVVKNVWNWPVCVEASH